MAAASKQKVKWGYVYFEEKGAAPARDWLESIDAGVRRERRPTDDHVLDAVNAFEPSPSRDAPHT